MVVSHYIFEIGLKNNLKIHCSDEDIERRVLLYLRHFDIFTKPATRKVRSEK